MIKKRMVATPLSWLFRSVEGVAGLEAQQQCFSYRAIAVVLVRQNSFVLVSMGYRRIVARYLAK